MKAKRLRDATCINPEYDRRLNKQRKAEGLEPIPHKIAVKKGEIVDNCHPGLCLGSNPAFEPADDDCRKAVAKILTNPLRKAELDNLKRSYELRKHLTKERREYVESLFNNHASEIEGSTPAQAAVAKASSSSGN